MQWRRCSSQPEAVLIGPMPNVQDNLDMSVEFEAFTTNWGEGYTRVSVGTEAISPSARD